MPIDPSLTNNGILSIKPFVPGLFVPHIRSIGGIFAHVTLEEVERDEVTATKHPVEYGAPISDHAFKQPSEVILRVGWNLQDGDLSAESGIYGIILNWQASFILFDLVTGKRTHPNMIMTSVVNTTDSTSEYALMLTISCGEIILTRTQATTVTSQNPKTPEDNSSVADRGTQQTTSIPSGDQRTTIIDANIPT